VTRTPAYPPKVFYRIRFSSDRNVFDHELRKLKSMIQQGSTSMVSNDLALRYQRGNGLVVASWDRWNPSSQAEVKALGVVTAIGANDERIVHWVPTYDSSLKLRRIDNPGAEHWDKMSFEFKGNVPKDFRLAELFSEHIADPFAAMRK